MAAVLNVDVDNMVQVAQYEDDSLEAWFIDGAKISLAACGTAFTRQGETSDKNSISSPSIVHQFTAYAARECRDRVRQLLSFRNNFADRPFLPPSLFSNEEQVSEKVVEYSSWPSDLQQATRCNLIQTSSTGNTRLLASDGSAWAELRSHGQSLATGYLARLPRDSRGSDRAVRGREEEEVEGGMAGLALSEGGEKTQESHRYLWTTELHSPFSTPDIWQYPLSLLQQHRSHDSHMTSTPQDEKENKRVDAVVSTPLPHPLPLTCHNSHLHQRHNSQEQRRLKVLFTEGILYRLFTNHTRQPFVEALPNQNTVLRSHDPEGRFFECWCVGMASGCVQRSMYCVDHVPPSSGLTFSMARVLGQASRLLNQSLKWEGGPMRQICWKAPSPLPSPPSSPCRYVVPGLGQFTVRTNGLVRCLFVDRTILDFYDSRSDTHCSVTGVGNSSFPPGGTRGVQVARGVWIGDHLCRLMQPNGRYVMVSMQHPANYGRYVEVVKEWCEWLARPEGERGHFSQGVIYDHNTQRQVFAELSKIDQFNASHTERLLKGRGLLDGCGLDMPSFVRNALQRTENTLQDIDNLLD